MQKTEPHTVESTATRAERQHERHIRPRVGRFAVGEFDRMFEAGVFGDVDHTRVEPIGGEVYEMAPVGSDHAA